MSFKETDIMAQKIFSGVLCTALYLCSVSGQQAINGKIKITVGTTAGCGDTVNFIANHLNDAYQEYGQFLELEFVPWGRTVRNADNSLTCQFGVNDCWANRLQRCALDLLKGNQDAQMFYMNCEFSNPRPGYLQGSYLCAQAAGLNLVDVDYCVNYSGASLDEAAQLAAREPMQIINFVPTVVFNDDINTQLSTQARQRLKSMICFALAEDPSTGVSNCQI